MTEKKEITAKKTQKDNVVLVGFKWGFGFWLAALAVLLLSMAVSTALLAML